MRHERYMTHLRWHSGKPPMNFDFVFRSVVEKASIYQLVYTYLFFLPQAKDHICVPCAKRVSEIAVNLTAILVDTLETCHISKSEYLPS